MCLQEDLNLYFAEYVIYLLYGEHSPRPGCHMMRIELSASYQLNDTGFARPQLVLGR